MIFIFDWGHTTRQVIGPLSKEDAAFKLQADYVYLVKERVWFRLFFIPTIVTEKRYYFIDSNSDQFQVIDKQTFDRYKNLAELNNQAMNDDISDAEYQTKRSQL